MRLAVVLVSSTGALVALIALIDDVWREREARRLLAIARKKAER